MKFRVIALIVLALSYPLILNGADVALFGIIKSQQFVQTNSGAPVALASNGFAFNAFVLASAPNVVTNATVKPSNSTPLQMLLPEDANQEAWRFEERFNSQANLDSAYPNGNIITPVRYTNTMFTVNDGVRALTLDYSLAPLAGSPTVPQITNYDAVRWIDQTLDLMLRFNKSGNEQLDLVQLIIRDTSSNLVFASPAPLSPGALTGASNSVVIPAYTLPPGTNLIGHLTFARPVSVNSNYVGAVGVAAVLKDTEFPLVIRPSPIRPTLEVISTGPPFQLRYTGETNRLYRLQATADFVAWTNLLVTNPPVPSAIFSDLESGGRPRRYYRIRVGQ